MPHAQYPLGFFWLPQIFGIVFVMEIDWYIYIFHEWDDGMKYHSELRGW